MDKLKHPIIVDFPLRGEWSAPHTPASKVPSHGTDMLGQRYAYDFMRVNWEKKQRYFFKTGIRSYLFPGIPLEKCLGWSENIYAPCDGKIIEAKNGCKERQRVHFITDMSVIISHALFFNPIKHDIRTIVGNYIIMEFNHIYALFAHLRLNSICVTEGQEVKCGDLLGQVGHSGNSTAPHLHFQLMDNPDLFKANGIPCAFRAYELFENGTWIDMADQIPSDKDRFRVMNEAF